MESGEGGIGAGEDLLRTTGVVIVASQPNGVGAWQCTSRRGLETYQEHATHDAGGSVLMGRATEASMEGQEPGRKESHYVELTKEAQMRRQISWLLRTARKHKNWIPMSLRRQGGMMGKWVG